MKAKTHQPRRYEVPSNGEPHGTGIKANGFAIAALLSLAGCAVGPDYSAPTTPPATFASADADLLVAQPLEAAWWELFGDPVLDDLIERALAADLDMRIAAARVGESRAVARRARREQGPRSRREA